MSLQPLFQQTYTTEFMDCIEFFYRCLLTLKTLLRSGDFRLSSSKILVLEEASQKLLQPPRDFLFCVVST
jgi:hypothetical protein